MLVKFFVILVQSRLGVGNVRPAGRIRPAKWKRPAPERFLNLNGIRPAIENDPAREWSDPARQTFSNFIWNPARKLKYLKISIKLFIINVTKQNCKTLTLKMFLKMTLFFCSDKNTILF